MTVRDVKPFVSLGVVPYFMDRKLIAETILLNECSRKEAVERLTKLWMEEKDHGN